MKKLFLISIFLFLPTILFAGKAEMFSCIKSEVKSYLEESGHASGHHLQFRCYGPYKDVVYRTKSWIFNGKRLYDQNWAYKTGVKVSNNIIDMCGNPCKH